MPTPPIRSSTPSYPPMVVLFIGILSASTAAIFIRYAQAEASSLIIAAYRLALASLILTPFMLPKKNDTLKGIQGKNMGVILLAGVVLALHFATWISSLQFTSVASSVVLVSTTPIWVALFSPFLLKEPVQRAAMFGMGLAFCGGVIITLSETCTIEQSLLVCPSMMEFLRGKAFLGNILAICGAIFAALYLIIGRRMRHQTSLSGYIFIVYSMAAIVLILLALIFSKPFLGFSRNIYLCFLLLALIPQLLGHTSINWSLKYLSAGFVSISLLGEPVGSTILAFFLLGENPGWWTVIGAILILLGIIFASKAEKKTQGVVSS